MFRTCTRRELLISTAAISLLRLPLRTAGAAEPPLRFGVISDIHLDIVHDGEARLRPFIEAMNEAHVDFIIQLGDFCVPLERNRRFMEIWNQFNGPRYHVMGNHDRDGFVDRGGPYAFTYDETMRFWNMPSPYYSFDRGGIHFIVLDSNEPGPNLRPYYRYIGDEQRQWLIDDLAATTLPTIIFSHHPFDDTGAGVIVNHADIRKIVEAAHHPDGSPKVLACFSGHLHRDYVRTIQGIYYPQINSASYVWLGEHIRNMPFGEAIDRTHPYLKHTAPYAKSLWAVVTIDRAGGALTIAGTTTQFVGPTPWELGGNETDFPRDMVRPAISNAKLALPAAR